MYRRKKLTFFNLLGDSEIRYLDATLVINQYIRSLDISMNDISLVQVIQATEDLSDEMPDKSLFERSVVTKKSGDGATGDVFQENVQVPAII